MFHPANSFLIRKDPIPVNQRMKSLDNGALVLDTAKKK